MAAEQSMYHVDERVDGLYDENTDDMWYPGRVRRVHLSDSADGPTFEVLYDDGEVETQVRPEFLRRHVAGTICVGTRVFCRYDGGQEFYPGQVSDVQENGMYTIAYDDGEVEEDVPLDHIVESIGDDEAAEEQDTNDFMKEKAIEAPQQQDQVEDNQDYPINPADDNGIADIQEKNVNEEGKMQDTEPWSQPRVDSFKYQEIREPTRQEEDHSEPAPERAYIVESLQLLEKRLGDAASTKLVLSTLVKQMRASPQITADLMHERDGERLIIDSLKFHQSHAVIQCYGFVLLRRLCFLCVQSTHYLLRNGIVELVIQAMNAFPEDAILQASACGALAVFTRVQAGLNSLIEYQVAQLVLSTLTYHKTYSVHTRQVHYYACEVLLELSELDDFQTLNLLSGAQDEDFTGEMCPVSILLFLLRQGLSLDDKKACCAVGSLLMCLAASSRRAAALILNLNGLAELSTVMARYPTEPSIQKYSAAASKQIALNSVRQSPTKRIKETATEILRETESLENTNRKFTKRNVRSTGINKRKSIPTPNYGTRGYQRGVYTSSQSSRNGQKFSKASPYKQEAIGYGDTNQYSNYLASSTAPQASSLVILEESFGINYSYESTSKHKQVSKESRQSELLDAYGIQGLPNTSNRRPYGTKRSQLKAHLASAESTWATPLQQGIRHDSYTTKPYSSRSDHGSAYCNGDFGQHRWDYGSDEPQKSVYDPEMKQNRGLKRKKKTNRTAFQVRLENDNQLRVSREIRVSSPSPQRLGVATKRAAKARQKRITGGTLSKRSNEFSSESLNDYATHLFQDNVGSLGTNIPTSSRLTPREKEEIRERERLSFAEKLHKMIDKAKATLANGNTTSITTPDDTIRSKKLSTTSKSVRRTRESLLDEKCPLSKKNRTTVSIANKPEVSSPRETRPSKLTTRLSTRHDAVAQRPAVPRTKPITSRSVVTPKTDSKPRTAVKSSRTTTPKLVEHNTVEVTSGEEPMTAAEESVMVPEQVIKSSEMEFTEQNEFVQVKECVEVADDAPESENARPEDEELVLNGKEDVGQESSLIVSAEEVAVVSEPAESEVDTDTTVETPPELSEPMVESGESLLEEPTDVPKSDDGQPSGANTIVDALYGDDYGEFDDNGGEEEDATTEAGADVDDAHIPTATGTLKATIDVLLQENKSGEALYDGYNEFDDDETEDAVATTEIVNDAITEQVEDHIGSKPTENAVEIKANDLVAENDFPSVTIEETVSLPIGLEVDHGNLEQNVNTDHQHVNADIYPSESEDVAKEPEQLRDPQSVVVDDDEHVETTENELYLPNSNAEEEMDNSMATNVDSNSVDDVNTGAEIQDDANLVPLAGEKDDNATTLESEFVAPQVEKADDEPAFEAEIDDVPPTVEPSEAESAVEISENSVQAADFNGEAQNADTSDQIGDVKDSIVGEMPENDQEDSPVVDVETYNQPEEPSVDRDSALLEQENENSKKLITDNSDANIQSAAYDEENFDTEEDEYEEKLSKTVEDVIVLIEQTEEIEKNLQEVDKPDCVEEESKVLVANSSDVSVQSAAYDDDFDDAGEEESSYEKNTEADNQVPDQQQASVVEDNAESEMYPQLDPVAVVLVDEAATEFADVREEENQQDVKTEPIVNPDNNEDEELISTLQDGTLLTESIVAEVTDKILEQQQEKLDDSAVNGESEELNSVVVTSDVPATIKDESGDIREVLDEADKETDELLDEIALEKDESSVASVTSTEDPLAANESGERKSEPPALAQDGEQANSIPDVQPEANDDDFNNGEEQENLNLKDEFTDESSQNDVNAPSLLEHTSSDTLVEVADSALDLVKVSEILPEYEQLADESTADEVETSEKLDTANDLVLEVHSPVSPIVGVVDQTESPVTVDNGASSSDKVDSVNAEPENTEENPVEENLESAAVDPVELALDADIVVKATSEETEVNNNTVLEIPDYEDVFEEDPIPTAAEVSVGLKSSTDVKDEEDQYEDAGFDDGENDADGAQTSSTEVVQSEKNVEGQQETEVIEDQDVKEEAPSSFTTLEEKELTPELSELVVDINDNADLAVDEQSGGDTAVKPVEVVDDLSGNADHDASNTTEAEIQDAAAYDEDFPSESPEGAVVETIGSRNEEVNSSDDAVAEAESPAVADTEHYDSDVHTDDSTPALSDSDTVPVLPSKEEECDDELDDENATSDPFDVDKTAAATSATDVEPVNTNIVLDNSAIEELPDDSDALETQQLNEVQTENNLVLPVQDEDKAIDDERDIGDSDHAEPAAAEPDVESTKDDEVDPHTVQFDATTPESIDLDAVDTETALESVETEAEDSENTAVDSVDPESEVLEPEPLEFVTTDSEPVDPEPAESQSVEVQAELLKSISAAVESESLEPETINDESALPDVTKNDTEAVELEPAESSIVEQTTTDSDVVEAEALTLEGTGSKIKEPEVRESTTGDDSDAVPKPLLDIPSANTDASQEGPLVQPLETPDPVTVDDKCLFTTETVVEAAVDVPMETIDFNPTEGDTSNADEDTTVDVDAIEPLENDEDVDNTENPQVEAPVVDNSSDKVETTSPEPLAVDSKIVAADELSVSSSVDAAKPEDDNADASEDTIPIAEVAKNDTIEDIDGLMEPDATISEPMEPVMSAVEAENVPLEHQNPIEDDYDEPSDEPVNATNDSVPDNDEEQDSSKDAIEEALSEDPDAPEKLTIQADPLKVDIEDEVAEGPTTEDQYDDEDGYNEFDEDNGNSVVPVDEATIETSTPVAVTETPASEDDYEEDENEDDDEELVDVPTLEQPKSDPPISARSEEIEEVADEPEEAEEETYADEQDEYEEDDTPVPISSKDSPKKDLPAEASAEYEDDEEYAEDEIEEIAPPVATKAVETEDEVDYDSDYTESD